MRIDRVTRLVAVAAVGLALTAAGCGDDEEETPAAGGGATTAAAGAGGDLVAKAQAEAKKFQAPAEFPKPTEAFKPGKGRMAIITCSMAGVDCATSAKDAVTATKAMGWTPSDIMDGKFTPQTQASLVNRAVQDKYDGILLISIDPASIKQAVDAAIAAKIPVACVLCYSPQYEGKIHIPATDWDAQGKGMAWNVIASSEGKGNIVTYDDKSYPATSVRTKAFAELVGAECPDCKTKNEAFPTTDLQKPGPPSFLALLAANPKGTITDVVDAYDAGSALYIKTLEQSGRSELGFHGYGADRAMVNAIIAGKAKSTMGDPWEYATWAGIDLIAREKAGAAEWDASKLPTVLIDKSNADGYVGKYYGPEGDWKSTFQELWGAAS